jgi:hypothetical protein
MDKMDHLMADKNKYNKNSQKGHKKTLQFVLSLAKNEVDENSNSIKNSM